jgi:hypothetical protein
VSYPAWSSEAAPFLVPVGISLMGHTCTTQGTESDMTYRNTLLDKLTAAYLARDVNEVGRIGAALYDLGVLDGTDTLDSVEDDILDEERADLMGAF